MESVTFTYSTSKHSYIYNSVGLSFRDANEHCRTIHNGGLVIPDNNQTWSNLLNGHRQLNLRHPYYRIGIKQQNGLLEWIDGSRSVNHSRIGSPIASATESCKDFAILFQDKQSQSELQFHAVNCSYSMTYICKKSTNMETFTTQSFVNSTEIQSFTANFEITDMTTFPTSSIPNTQLIDLHSVLLPCIAAVLLICGLIIFCAFLYKNHTVKLKSTSSPRVITQHNCFINHN